MKADGQSPEVFESSSPAQTRAFGRRLAKRLGKGSLVAMEGELGAGKTVLVRGIAAGLGVADQRDVTSPTYVLVQEYQGRWPIFHIDLYRLRHPAAELTDLAMGEMLEAGVVLIEWADRAAASLPRPFWRVRIEHAGPRHRRLSVEQVR